MNHQKIQNMMILMIHGWNQSESHRFLYCFLSFLLLVLFALFEIENHSVIKSEHHLVLTTAFRFAKAFITTITWQSNFDELFAQTYEGKS